MDKKDLTKFSLSIYGNITAFNEVLSKARCRIFYKYGNRNGTYITDEFAEKLISTLPYVPVKGIYDAVEDDFTDHGHERYEGRIYGIVPENPNFAWETHLDEDGVEREYACTDVYLFTGIYKKEALDVLQKSQSMELYADSIQGEWKFIDGKKYYVFTDGCFLGLQALGEKYEPCFEGAAFYTLIDSVENIMHQIEEYEAQTKEEIGGQPMNFKLSDNQKYNMIWTLLNSRFNEENDYTMDYAICDVYDDYAVVYNFESQGYERVYYTKDDETDSLEITSREAAYIIDVNAEEKRALDVLHKMNDNTYEKIDEKFDTLQQNVDEFSQKNEEQAGQISTLEQEKANMKADLDKVTEDYTNAQAQIQTLTEENEELNTYKHDVMTAQKNELIDRYNDLLNEEVLNTYREKVEDWTYESLEKELAFTLVQTKPTLFSNEEGISGRAPKDDTPEEGIAGILSRYKK
jgi:predicted nuclease with TOPRIM domain